MIKNILKKTGASSNILAQSQPFMAIGRRFDGGYPWYQSMAEMVPRKNHRIADESLDETEIITRMLYVFNSFHLYDLTKIDWNKPFDEQGIDSLEATAVLTSIEHEFHTIFEDRVFENFENFKQVKDHLAMDHNAF